MAFKNFSNKSKNYIHNSNLNTMVQLEATQSSRKAMEKLKN